MSSLTRALTLAVSLLAVMHAVFAAECPCGDPALCKPLKAGPRPKELYVFSVSPGAWKSYNLTYVSTILPFYSVSDDPTLVCTAHSHGIRISMQATDFPLANLSSSADRKAWVQKQLDRVQATGADDLNIDIESPISHPDQPALLTVLVQETTAAFHAWNPHSQVSFDVAWGPRDVDGRSYDYVGLSKAADVLFVMGYDERSQVWSGPCVAGANAGLPQTETGVTQYLHLGIPRSKLLLGVPWYGRLYPCVSLVGNVCTIKHVPFRGCNCSDAAAAEIPLENIPIPPEGPQWDAETSSEFFNINGTHQMWYDDPRSLTLKYGYAAKEGLKGVGMWTGDFSQLNTMWTAFDAFFRA